MCGGEQAQQSAQLSQLTLQEALRTLRPDFVHRSEARQHALKRNRELRTYTRPRSARQFTSSGKDVYVTVSGKGNPRTPQFFYGTTHCCQCTIHNKGEGGWEGVWEGSDGRSGGQEGGREGGREGGSQ